MTEPLKLTRAQKAAAILVAMGKPAAGRLLKFFKQEELKALIEAARKLQTIPQADLERIVAEFESEFAEGAGLLDSADQMNLLLSESLSPEEISVLMGQAAPRPQESGPSTVWADLEKLDPLRVAELLGAEHPQTVAFVLSNLGAEPSARVLVALEKTTRTEVVRRMITISQIKPGVRQLIERQMRALIYAESGGKDVTAGQSRVATLLNQLDQSQVDEVMRDLEESGATDVASIRARLFSFEQLPLLQQKARVSLFDGLDTDMVTLALRGASRDITEAILSALGARSRRMIESELSVPAEGIPAEDITRARKRIAATAVQLSQKGVIALPSEQGERDEAA